MTIPDNTLLTRRGLLSGVAVVGALHFLGSFTSARGVTMAYADDAGNTHFKVYVLNREQVPIVALNVRRGVNEPVPGMKVTLTSRCNDASTSAVTDEFGCAVANIRALADNAEEDTASSYAAYMQVSGEIEGWQTFMETKRLVESGVHADSEGNMPNTIQVPTVPDTGWPYLSCLCLDGTDVQYLPQTVGLNAGNDMLHVLEVRVEHADKRESLLNKWRFALVHRHEHDSPFTGYAYATPVGSVVEAQLSGAWLDGAHGIAAGDEVQLYYSPVDNELMGLVTLPLSFEDIELPMPGLEEDLMISPGNQPTKDKKGVMGEFFEWFVCKNDTLNQGIPLLPMEIFIDIYGNMGISAVIETCTLYKCKDGKKVDIPKKDRWKSFIDNSDDAWLNKFKEEFADNAERWLSSTMDGDDGPIKAFGASPVTSKLTATFTVEMQAFANRKENEAGDAHYHGDFAVIGRLAVNYMAAQQITVAYIPVYWMFDFKAQALLKLLSGIQFDQGFANLEFGHEVMGRYSFPFATVFVFELEAGFTVGVGVMGILSVGVRGYGNLLLTATSDTSGGPRDASAPHLTIVGKASIQLAVQALLFKKTITLTNWGPWTLYDNWDSEAAGSLAAGSNALPDARFGTIANPVGELQTAPVTCEDLEQVSEASLAQCAEFQATMSNLGLCSYGPNTAGAETLQVAGGESAGIREPYAGALPVVGMGAPFGAEGYNPLRGVRPSTQKLLWQDVFSAPRAKVVQVGAETYLLRISTVTVEVEEGNQSLQLVKDSKGHVFAQAKVGHSLPSLELAPDGKTLAYPDLGSGVCVAHIDSFDAGYELGEQDAQGELLFGSTQGLASLVGSLTGPDAGAFASTRPANTSYVTRSRLTISRYLDGEWREPQVIDFALPTTTAGYLRANTWDVDFDAVGFRNDSFNKHRIYILLSSIVRVVDDESFEEQFKNQFLTLLSYDSWNNELEYVYSNLSDYNAGAVCWHPRVAVSQRDYQEKGTSYDVVSVFYYRNKMDETGGIDYAQTTMKYACWSIDTQSHDRYRYGSGTVDLSFDDFMRSHLAEGTFELRNRLFDNNAQRNLYEIGWTIPAQPEDAAAGIAGHESAGVFWTADAQYASCQGFKRIDGIEHCAIGQTSWYTPMETSWFYTLASENGGDRLLRRLKMTAEPYDGGATVSFASTWPIGQIANAQGFFCDARGNRLYAVRAMEGTAPELGAHAKEAIDDGAIVCGTYSPLNSSQAEHLSTANDEGSEVRLYQLLCAHYDSQHDSYHDFFPLAELDFAPDYAIALNLESGSYEFIMGSITDLDCNTMNVYHVAVPQVMGLQLEGASAVSHFAMPGDAIKCQVRLTNTGNTPIIGFDATLWDDEFEGKLDEISVENLAGSVQVTEDMVCPIYTSDGLPTDEYEKKEDILDASGILWPGKIRNYHIVFNLPESIPDGEHSFHITVANPTRERSLIASLEAADDQNLCLAVDPRARRFDAKLGAEGTVRTNRREPECSSNVEPGGNMPGTGDASGLVAGMALAATAAAGLLAAGAKIRGKLKDEDGA